MNKKYTILMILMLLIISLQGLTVVSDPLSSNVTKFSSTLITKSGDYTTAGYPIERVVDPVLYTPEALCEGHIPIVLNIECSTSFSIEKEIKNSFLSSLEIGKSSFTDINYKYRILTINYFLKDIPIFAKVNYSLYDQVNGTWNNYTSDEITGYKQVMDYNYIWKEIKDISKIDFTAKNKIIIDVQGNFKAKLGGRSIDVVPEIKIGDYTQTLDKYAWWDSNWNYKKNITIDHTKVYETLTKFPVLISFTDTDLKDHTQSDGDDICFIDSTETTQYNHEIETYVSATGQLVAWVNITSLSSVTNTTIWMYYGNGICSSQQDVTGTWDTGRYVGVWHMNDLTTSTVNDSINIKDGTKKSANNPKQKNGKIGFCQNFDGSDIIWIFSSGGLPSRNFSTKPITMSCWFKANSTAATQILYTTSHLISGEKDTQLFINSDSKVYQNYRTSSGVGKSVYNTISAGNWYFVEGVRQSNYVVRGYLNGTWMTTNNVTGANANYASSNREYLGSSIDTSQYLNGYMDEVRLETGNTSFNMHKTSYANQNSPATFYAVGSQISATVGSIYQNFENPANWTTGVTTLFPVLEVLINQSEGLTMNWTIEVSNGDNASGSGASNGTINITTSKLNSNTTYIWWVNVTDEIVVSNKTYYFNTSMVPYLSLDSYQTNRSIYHNVEIIATDPDSDDITLYYLYNDSGNWTELFNETVINGNTSTLTNFSNATSWETNYTLNVNATDGKGCWFNTSYNFTTTALPMLSCIANNSEHLDVMPIVKFQLNYKIFNATDGCYVKNVSWYNSTDGVNFTLFDNDQSSISWVNPALNISKKFTFATLANTTYYWYVVVNGDYGAIPNAFYTNTSAIWNFKTSEPPNPATNPTPADSETGTSVTPAFAVTASDPENDTMNLTYHLSDNTEFGNVSILGNTTLAWLLWADTYNLALWNGHLLYNTGYDWYVNTTDQWGSTTKSDVWSFTTKESTAPEIALISPANGLNDVDYSKQVTLSCNVTDVDGDQFNVTFWLDGAILHTYTLQTDGIFSYTIPYYLNSYTNYSWNVSVIEYTNQYKSNDSATYTFKTRSSTIFQEVSIPELAAFISFGIAFILWLFFLILLNKDVERLEIENWLYSVGLLAVTLVITGATYFITLSLLTTGLLGTIFFVIALYYLFKHSTLMFGKET
jgi:hypothetical protein